MFKRIIKFFLRIPYKILKKICKSVGYDLVVSLKNEENIRWSIEDLYEKFPLIYYQTYSEDSLNSKRFYNIGSGNQRSQSPYWTYIDLPSDSYGQDHMDIPFDLESLEVLPLESNKAEVIFNSFLLEHISWDATKNLIKEAFRTLKSEGIFYSRVHCCDYGMYLLKNNVISRKFMYSRESHKELVEFLEKNYKYIDLDKDIKILR